LTFVASANAIRYVGAEPVFIDCEADSWNLDPNLVEETLVEAERNREPIAAVLAVDLYGRCCDYDALEQLCAERGVTLLEDAAEALGASYRGRAAGTFGKSGAFSFNGNKIITTSGGGMLVTEDGMAAVRARYLATQARDAAPHYEHSVTGFNYRLSNLLAAVGRGQLRGLEEKVARRRAIRARYQERLGVHPGVSIPGDGPHDRTNAWLTCATIDPARAGASREDVRVHLASRGIEARPVWKPMHLQPLFAGCRTVGGGVAGRLFGQGLCLPSGSSLTGDEQDEICSEVLSVLQD
jgi:dTDP-4-amino-4,6-dideoxygalactose transaminase